ncbi:MAG: hypothetical protein ACRETU_06015 [Steroidobacterales bacterium]
MRRINIACVFGAALMATCASLGAVATETAPTATEGLTSRMEHGVVTLVANPELMNGRVILKIVAFNGSSDPAKFSGEDIHIFTSAGKPVQLVSLDRLIEERRLAAAQPAPMTTSHDPANYSHPEVRHSGVGGSGAMEVNGITGASNPTNGVMSPYTRSNSAPEADNLKLQAEIANLKAAILHPLSIAPAQAEGGQIVTEKPRFARKDARALRVVVNFNGDEHAFDFTLPALQ